MRLQRRRAYTKRKSWASKEESELLNYLKKNNFDSEKLSKMFPKRTHPSIRSKVRKVRINYDLFGKNYRENKIAFTKQIANKMKVNSIFEAYAGAGHQTLEWIKHSKILYASEKNKIKIKQFKKNVNKQGFQNLKSDLFGWELFKKNDSKVYLYCGDAVNAATSLNINNKKIDLIDLDTCGSTLPTIPFFLLLLSPKHIVITHGEFHSMRFKREDVLRRLLCHRDVNKSPLPISVDDMADELDKAVKLSALRCHNETIDSFWLNLKDEKWLGGKFHGMLRRHYEVSRPPATADCLNLLAKK